MKQFNWPMWRIRGHQGQAEAPPGFYIVRAHCTNCGTAQSIIFPKGTPVYVRDKICENCGCEGAIVRK